MKNRIISEYGVVKKSKDAYYVIGSTIVAKDEYGYYDLIGNRRIKMFDFQNFADGEEGIIFEKNVEYYLNKQLVLDESFKQYTTDKLQNIEEILNNHHIKNKLILKVCKLLQKSSIRNPQKLQILNNVIEYLNELISKAWNNDCSYEEYILKKEQLNKILLCFQSIATKYDICRKKYIEFAINIKLLNDLNKDPRASRISTRKSLIYYAQNNGMVYPTHDEWVKVNSLKKI